MKDNDSKFLIRNARKDDLSQLLELTKSFDTINLPYDEEAVLQLLEDSNAAFNDAERRSDGHTYLFVLEDVESKGNLVGTSLIMAKHGTLSAPHTFLRLQHEEHYAPTLKTYMKHQTLKLGFNYDGPTEVGGLVLEPAFRGHPQRLGMLLSMIRFMFMAIRPERFEPTVLAELLPHFREDGTSPLWDALGKRFTGLDYDVADKLSREDKEFTQRLFPKSAIYTTLLSEEVRETLGQVGPGSRGAERILRKLGFAPVRRLDPFDGGPHFEAKLEDLWSTRNTQNFPWRAAADLNALPTHGARAVLGQTQLDGPPRYFRALQADYVNLQGTIHVSEKDASLLRLDPNLPLSVFHYPKDDSRKRN